MGIFRNPAVIITLILLVVVLFGARRLPDVAKSVGTSLKIFKKEVRELRDDDEDEPRRSTTESASTEAGSGTGAPAGTSATTPAPPTSAAGTSDPGPGAGEHRNA
ncbi:sec-independent protein translocase protein TatA [Isoptericola sp. CG 20/1183]|uniref:Sec-independent protein translocase protein TatA n=1 Tax=Isoptericola halotolerans TaxID=300560 RepID=A0ABX5EB56_9MICO|nr:MULTISPECIES: twin-arginine translocase TatA/TatE family subunit [Isoptericola]MCK0115428.1 twin-arginine translocase TatA/TatE family subunit [Isoptericola sp. S6320L]PRZ04499.1 sec-independent protein translocase protein TatA [Isoptericola halotolerans]PRZ04603.1 sec-independent protein translocase protein TatA [Isoptericola sp. CG 20/1183]